jgi:hypothetical protein
MKIFKISRFIILVISFVFLTILYYPIGKLAITDNKVTKSIFREEYYVKTTNNEYETIVFKKYMLKNGWIENEKERMGGIYVFEKDGKKKYITNGALKTIFVNGWPNF